MSCHKHLTLLEREKLALALAKGQRISQIAKELCIDRSTVYRELKRNTSHGEYLPALAQQAYQKRRLRSRRKKIFADGTLYLHVARLFLDLQWSPQQIANRLRLEGTGHVSYITIYRAILVSAIPWYSLTDIATQIENFATAAKAATRRITRKSEAEWPSATP